MSKRLLVFRADHGRAITRPWRKVGGVWKAATKVYRREPTRSDGGDAATIFTGPPSDGGDAATIFEGATNSLWVEWWPLLPDPPTGVVGNFLYRNDQIELDIDWTEAVGGPDVAEYRITLSIDGAQWSWTQVGNATFTAPGAWQQYAGKTARVSITGISPFGDAGAVAQSPQYIVPQLPPPPDPSGVAVAIVNRGASATWLHTGGNRLASFELRTSYRGTTRPTTAAKGARSQDVTFWSTVATPGDPGGSVGFLIRAVGPGGSSSWVGSSGAVASVPNPPPPPAVILPGTVAITSHRFLNGQLRCEITAPNSAYTKVWWERLGGGLTYVGTTGTSGSVIIAGSESWPRDDTNLYRIHVQGVNSAGAGGVTSVGPWARKLPNPYNLTPNDFISMRGQYPDGEYYPFSAGYLGGLNLRQGSSYNVFAYLKPIIVWRGYVGYNEGLLAPSRVGYTPTVVSAQVWMQRNESGGSGSAVRPRLWWHGYESLKSPGPGTSLINGKDLAPMARGQAMWQDVDVTYARKLVNPSDPIKGIALYHPNSTLLSYLGEVSAEYMIMNGPFAVPFGVSCFTMRLYHDG